MDMSKEQINEVIENQTHILNAMKNLDERLKSVEDKTMENHESDIKDILESQGMLDEIIVKSCNDILVIRKLKKKMLPP